MGDPSAAPSGDLGGPLIGDKQVGLGLEVIDARGRSRNTAALVEVQVLRELGEADIPRLITPGRVTPPGQQRSIQQLRYAHHRLAELLASGVAPIDAALITGYSVQRVRDLQASDPAFRELIVHYQASRELKFVDVMDRMRSLGLATLEELQDQMLERPETFTNREKMDLVELMLVKGRSAPGVAAGAPVAGAPGGVVVNVKFVGAEAKTTIEGEIVRG